MSGDLQFPLHGSLRQMFVLYQVIDLLLKLSCASWQLNALIESRRFSWQSLLMCEISCLVPCANEIDLALYLTRVWWQLKEKRKERKKRGKRKKFYRSSNSHSHSQYYIHIHNATFTFTILPSHSQDYFHVHNTTFTFTILPSIDHTVI